MDKQVWPKASLLQDKAGGRGRGGHLALGDVKAQPPEQPHQVAPRLLGLVGAEPHLQPGLLQSAGVDDRWRVLLPCGAGGLQGKEMDRHFSTGSQVTRADQVPEVP